MQLNIKEEFKNLIPPLSKEEYDILEEKLLAEGIRDNLILWNNFILDGHNRFELAQKHNLEFKTTSMKFDSEKQAKEWIILNQFGRRNITIYDRSVLALRLKHLFAEKAKKRMLNGSPVPKSEQGRTIENVAKVAEVSKDTIAKVEKIEAKATDEQKKKIREGYATINRIYKDIVGEERKVKYKKGIKDNPLSGKYRIIYADPPWKYNDKLLEEYGGADKHYDTMSIKQLCGLPVKDICEDNAVLFLWVTSPFFEKSFEIIKAWGFIYKTSFVWDKVKHNMGHYNSVRHELLLVCTKGSCTPDNLLLFDSVQSIQRSNKHSEKPEEFRKIIEATYSLGNKIELFARSKKDGWTCWGNQTKETMQ